MSLRAEMPPVIMPGANGEDIDIGLGDVWIEASVESVAKQPSQPLPWGCISLQFSVVV